MFVESDELQNAIEDDCRSLMEAMENEVYKERIIKNIGEEEYKKKYETLKKLALKEETQGKFTAIEGALD